MRTLSLLKKKIQDYWSCRRSPEVKANAEEHSRSVLLSVWWQTIGHFFNRRMKHVFTKETAVLRRWGRGKKDFSLMKHLSLKRQLSKSVTVANLYEHLLITQYFVYNFSTDLLTNIWFLCLSSKVIIAMLMPESSWIHCSFYPFVR